jgi:ATP-dependent helicase HrpA
VGKDVVSTAHFDSWWKARRRTDPELLTFSLDMVVHDAAAQVSAADFPDAWLHGDAELPLVYEFNPGAETDGVTVDIPVTSLNRLQQADFSWPVPGLREELVVALFRSLPKRLRVNFVPAPSHARAFLAATTPGEEPLLASLERYLRRTTGVVVHRDDWSLDKVPSHLLPTFRVHSLSGDMLGQGKDLDALKDDLQSVAGAEISSAGASLERAGLKTWDFGTLPQVFTQTRAGHEVTGYPALVDQRASVAIKVLGTHSEQTDAMRLGVRRLLMLSVASPGPAIVQSLDNAQKLALGLNPHGSVPALLEDCHAAAIDVIVQESGGAPWDESGFAQLRERVSTAGPALAAGIVDLVQGILVEAYQVDRRLSGRAELAVLPALTDMKSQWAGLVHPGFVADAGRDALQHYRRYLAAVGERLDKLATDPRRDAVLMGSMAGVQAAYRSAVESLPPHAVPSAALRDIRWMLEELRVSLWAQHLKTPRPISVQRVERALRDL